MFQLDNPYSQQKTIQEYQAQNQAVQANDQKIKDNEIQRLVNIATPDNYQAIRQEGISKGLWTEQEAPMDYQSAEPIITQLRQAYNSKASTMPSTLQTYQAYANMTPEQRDLFNQANRSAASQFINLGDRSYNPYTGASYDKGVSPDQEPELKRQQEEAKKQAVLSTEAQEQLPTVLNNAFEATKTIDEALNAPGFDKNFGKMAYVPNRYGSEASDAKTYIDRLGGQAFLTAYGALKGGGQITEMEGQKATDAIARLQKAQSPESARAALQDLKGVIDRAKQVAVDKASGKYFKENLNTIIQPKSDNSGVPVVDFEDNGDLTEGSMDAPVDPKRARLEELRRKKAGI